MNPKLPFTREDFVESFAQAIATMEGFYKPGSRAQINNNPGNIRKWGNKPTIGGYAKFDNVAKGFEALRSQIRKNLFERNLTMLAFFAGEPGVYPGYAPAADSNKPTAYAEFVCGVINKQHPEAALKLDSVPDNFTFSV